jgi:hypothetical protein
MQLTVTLGGLAALSRFDPEPLVARLRADVERELQAMTISDTPIDPAARRDALVRVLGTLNAAAGSTSPLPLGERT